MKEDIKNNRSKGWYNAKITGHQNEEMVNNLFNDLSFKEDFEKRLNIDKIKKHTIGGICEKQVECILGGTTHSKTDLSLFTENESRINISIKKSKSGQVYLIDVNRFINGFEKQYKKVIPDNVKETLKLYFYGHSNTEELLNDENIIKGQPKKLIEYQKKRNRLVWESLVNFDNNKAESLIEWFKDNICDIVDFCFSRGLSKNKEDFVDYVWYINKVGGKNIDALFSIDDIKNIMLYKLEMIKVGNRNGGSTINLPFGFVQWHQKQIQFHHKMKVLLEFLEPI